MKVTYIQVHDKDDKGYVLHGGHHTVKGCKTCTETNELFVRVNRKIRERLG